MPLVVVNDTAGELPVELALEPGPRIQLEGEGRGELVVGAGARGRRQFKLDVVGPAGDCRLTARATAGDLADEVTATLKVVPLDLPDNGAGGGAPGDAAHPVRLSARLAKEEVAWGESVALVAEVVNTTEDRQPRTVAVLGLPAGLAVGLGQLDRLQRAGKLDYYETRCREVLCYWTTLDPKEQVELTLELIAAVPGQFRGPACRAYLVGAGDRPQFGEPLSVTIRAN